MDSDRHPSTDRHTSTDSATHGHANTHQYTNSNYDTLVVGLTDTNSDTNSDGYPNVAANSYTFPNMDSINTHRTWNTDTYAYINSNTTEL